MPKSSKYSTDTVVESVVFDEVNPGNTLNYYKARGVANVTVSNELQAAVWNDANASIW